MLAVFTFGFVSGSLAVLVALAIGKAWDAWRREDEVDPVSVPRNWW